MKAAPSLFAAGLFFQLCELAAAQSNTVAGRDIKLHQLGTIATLGRVGAFPNGLNGLAESTTVCNIGTGVVPWEQAMDPDHPFISFLVLREANGRFEQVSDRSFVKHGFFSTNTSLCGACQNPFSSQKLGVNCSDTYSTLNNGNRFWLAPPDEIDPWLGIWEPICSHFDKGEPPVPPPQDCDGIRSLTQAQVNAMDPVNHRITVLDSDLNVAGASFYFQGMYTTQGEAESLRGDNLGSRSFTPTWNGTSWVLTVPGAGNPIVYGSILQRWAGASVSSATNGADDGRFYVAVKVTGPTGGLFRYEYAVHNRDNFRGAGSFRIPACSGARVLNPSFRDVDQDPTNDWTFTVQPGEAVFSTPASPLLWNTVFNFAFDSDAGPLAGTATMDQFNPGGGAPAVVVATSAPLELYNPYLGPGCGSPAAPSLYAIGSPNKATIPNPTFGLQCGGVAPGSTNFLLASLVDGTFSLNPSCTLYMDLASILVWGVFPADGSGTVTVPIPIPNSPSLEGLHADFQDVEFQPGSGALYNSYDLSNGLQVRIGNAIPGCP